jgi:cystathionine beta-lyase
MNYDFDHIIDRRNSDSIKWNKYAEDVIPLWVADMDFLPPQPVLNALNDRIKHGVFGYSDPQDATKQAICSWLSRRHQWSVLPEDIVLFPGIVPAFNVATRVFTNPGDSVLIQTPAYHPFFNLPIHSSITLVQEALQTNHEGKYELNPVQFKESLCPNTRLFMLCNPQNPTGRVFTKPELSSIAEICLEHNILICSDEIHSDLVFLPNKHLPIATLSEEIAQATITMIAPSKTFNLAGLHSSAVIIQNEALREQFIQGISGYGKSVNVLGEVAMSAAYNHGEDWLENLLAYLNNNRQILYDFVTNELHGVSLSLPEGTYLGWLDFRETDLDSPAEYLLDTAKVALNAGDWFGSEYSKFARINFACPLSRLVTALHQIKSALDSP